jgi:hypothetical protein
MTTIHMTLEPGPGHRWSVVAGEHQPEIYTCPLQALLRAKHLFKQIPACESGALMISLDGEHSTRLLSRPGSGYGEQAAA